MNTSNKIGINIKKGKGKKKMMKVWNKPIWKILVISIVLVMVASGFAAMVSADITLESDVESSSATIYVPDDCATTQQDVDEFAVVLTPQKQHLQENDTLNNNLSGLPIIKTLSVKPEAVMLTIKNEGRQPAINVPVSVLIGKTKIGNVTLNRIDPGATFKVSFAHAFPAITPMSITCRIDEPYGKAQTFIVNTSSAKIMSQTINAGGGGGAPRQVNLLWEVEHWGTISGEATGDIDGDGIAEVVVRADKGVMAFEGDGSLKWSYDSKYSGNVGRGLISIGDIDADGENEIVAGAECGVLVLSGDGRLKWMYYTENGLGSDEIQSVSINDIDGDGVNEVIAGSWFYVYALEGDGSLKWRYDITDIGISGSGGISTSIGDIDDDGINEIVAECGDDYICAIEGNGVIKWAYDVGSQTTSMFVGDIDDDGASEVVVGSWNNNITAIEGYGIKKWSYETGGCVHSVFIGDIDDDGIGEIIAGSGDNNIYALEGDGSLKWTYDTGEDDHYRVGPVYVDDIDGDGSNEVIAGRGYSSGSGFYGDIYALEGNGTLKWRCETSGWDAVHLISTGDIDGDETKEVIAGLWFNVYAIESNGTIRWGYETESEIETVSAGDIDGDEMDEVIAGSYCPGYKIYAFEHDGKQKWVFNAPGWIRQVTTADIDGDGVNEVIATANDSLYVLEGNGTLKWSYAGGWMSQIATGDIDGDGIDEIVTGSSYPSCKVYAFEGNGTLKWSAYYANSHVYAVSVGNIDSDAEEEVVAGANWCLVGTPGDSMLYAYEGDGTLKWSCDAGWTNPGSIAIGDIDGDGIGEVIASYGGSVHAFEGDGTLKWTQSGGGLVSVGDIDGDGIDEVITGSVRAFEGDGSLKWIYDTGGAESIAIGDIDADGVNEVVVGCWNNNITAIEGDGTLKWNYTTGSVVRSVAIGDLNDDGIDDVVAGSLGIYALATGMREGEIFDTGTGTYPSIMGNHTGTITPNQTITVSKLYTYPCSGTGGHTESIELYENDTLIANGSWNGYGGDWHNITIYNLTRETPYVTLLKDHKYNYTIRTGSYPQIHHNATLLTKNGWINCTSFIDANGKKHDDGIPAIKFFLI